MRPNWHSIAPFACVLVAATVGCRAPDPSVRAPLASDLAVEAGSVTARRIEMMPLVECAEISWMLEERLQVGMTGAQLRSVLSVADFVYREHRVVSNHHVKLPKSGETTTQFGCIDGPVRKMNTELEANEGPVPKVRFYLRMSGTKGSTLAAFLSAPDARLVEFSRVEQAPGKVREEELAANGG